MRRETADDFRALGHKPMSLHSAIKAKCGWCSNGDWRSVVKCNIRDCPLYPFRLTNPWKKERTPAQREATRRLTERRLAQAPRLDGGATLKVDAPYHPPSPNAPSSPPTNLGLGGGP